MINFTVENWLTHLNGVIRVNTISDGWSWIVCHLTRCNVKDANKASFDIWVHRPHVWVWCLLSHRTPFLVQCSAVSILKLLIFLNKCLHSHFALRPANNVQHHFCDIPAKDVYNWIWNTRQTQFDEHSTNSIACTLQVWRSWKSLKDWGTVLRWRRLRIHDNCQAGFCAESFGHCWDNWWNLKGVWGLDSNNAAVLISPFWWLHGGYAGKCSCCTSSKLKSLRWWSIMLATYSQRV